MTEKSIELVGGVLCGGRSRRMGGDKSGLRLDGRTMLERVCDVAAEITDLVVLLGRPREIPENLHHLFVLEDDRPGLGPIAGLAGALTAFPGAQVLLLACDLPLIRPDVVRLLLAEPQSPGFEAVCFESPARAGGLEPCAALYLPGIRPRVERAIARGALSLHGLLAEARVRVVRLPEQWTDCLRNVNTPQDYRSIRESLGRFGTPERGDDSATGFC